MWRANNLVRLLRALSVVNFAAIVAVVAPGNWLSACHESLGLGSFPTEPIAWYLARTTSLWFAAFGIFLWLVARDVNRYAAVIQFLGWAMFLQGVATLVIDWTAGLPGWWIAAEGPTCVALGAAMLYLQAGLGAANDTGCNLVSRAASARG